MSWSGIYCHAGINLRKKETDLSARPENEYSVTTYEELEAAIETKEKQTSQQTGSAYREDTKQAVNRYSHSDTAINKCTCSNLTWVPMRRLGQSIKIFSYTPCLQMV